MRDMEKFDPMEHIEALNTLRKATIGKYFGEKEFRVLLKTCGLPSNPVFFVEFSKNILIKNNGQYTWRPDKILLIWVMPMNSTLLVRSPIWISGVTRKDNVIL